MSCPTDRTPMIYCLSFTRKWDSLPISYTHFTTLHKTEMLSTPRTTLKESLIRPFSSSLPTWTPTTSTTRSSETNSLIPKDSIKHSSRTSPIPIEIFLFNSVLFFSKSIQQHQTVIRLRVYLFYDAVFVVEIQKYIHFRKLLFNGFVGVEQILIMNWVLGVRYFVDCLRYADSFHVFVQDVALLMIDDVYVPHAV